jgi:hypothetical protein
MSLRPGISTRAAAATTVTPNLPDKLVIEKGLVVRQTDKFHLTDVRGKVGACQIGHAQVDHQHHRDKKKQQHQHTRRSHKRIGAQISPQSAGSTALHL